MTDDNELSEIDLHVWNVPPPAPIDRAALLGRALSPAARMPRSSRFGWWLAAIVVVNAAIATLIIVVTRPAPTVATMTLAGGGESDARMRELIARVEQTQRELARRLDELDVLRAEIAGLAKRLKTLEQKDPSALEHATPTKVVPPTKLVTPSKTPTPPTHVVAPTVTPTSLPPLDREAISSTIRRVKPQITACGERFPADGTLKVRVRVASDGTATSVTVDEAPSEALGNCVANVIAAAKFARTQGGAFSYPFVFKR